MSEPKYSDHFHPEGYESWCGKQDEETEWVCTRALDHEGECEACRKSYEGEPEPLCVWGIPEPKYGDHSSYTEDEAGDGCWCDVGNKNFLCTRPPGHEGEHESVNPFNGRPNGPTWEAPLPATLVEFKDEKPNYYGERGGTYECIKVIRAWDLDFELGNVLKYVKRAGAKPGESAIKDLGEAKTYIDLEIERLTAQEGSE
jgi:hypothetical protein